jgi:hypothetical protein
MEKVKNINSLFSTADAEEVKYFYEDCDLTLEFIDWSGISFKILFRDVEYFKVDDFIDYKKFRGDCPHEIINSELIPAKELDEDEFHHYILCFNAWSNIELISSKLEILK